MAPRSLVATSAAITGVPYLCRAAKGGQEANVKAFPLSTTLLELRQAPAGLLVTTSAQTPVEAAPMRSTHGEEATPPRSSGLAPTPASEVAISPAWPCPRAAPPAKRYKVGRASAMLNTASAVGVRGRALADVPCGSTYHCAGEMAPTDRSYLVNLSTQVGSTHYQLTSIPDSRPRCLQCITTRSRKSVSPTVVR